MSNSNTGQPSVLCSLVQLMEGLNGRYYWLDKARARGYTRLPRLLPSSTRTLSMRVYIGKTAGRTRKPERKPKLQGYFEDTQNFPTQR